MAAPPNAPHQLQADELQPTQSDGFR